MSNCTAILSSKFPGIFFLRHVAQLPCSKLPKHGVNLIKQALSFVVINRKVYLQDMELHQHHTFYSDGTNQEQPARKSMLLSLQEIAVHRTKLNESLEHSKAISEV